MVKFIAGRLLVAVIFFFVISLIIFSTLYFLDPMKPIIPLRPDLPESEKEWLTTKMWAVLGYEPPTLAALPGKYADWVGDFFTGNWGESLVHTSPYPQ